MPASSFRIRTRATERVIRGAVNAATIEGLFVNYDPSDVLAATLLPATGIRGFALAREVGTQAALQAQLVNDQVFPVNVPAKNIALVGDVVAAHGVREGEYEGPLFVLASGTGLLNGSTAIGTALGLVAGVLRVKQSGDELVGYVRGKLALEDPTNTVRLLVEFV